MLNGNRESSILGQVAVIGKVTELRIMPSDGWPGKFVLHVLAVAGLLALAPVDIRALGKEPAPPETDRFARWEQAIRELEQHDNEHPTKSGGTVFVGSSSIRFWNLEKWFSGINPLPLNRGFGGSQIADSTYFADRIILKYNPRLIVFYAGDNDIAAGKSAKQVATDFANFCQVIHDTRPETRIAFIAIKPSPSRWKFARTQIDANAAIRAQCNADERLEYIDIWSPMIGESGDPREELFRKDMLHLNEEGYRLWTDLVRPLLEKGKETNK